jgi:hypothetical protein
MHGFTPPRGAIHRVSDVTDGVLVVGLWTPSVQLVTVVDGGVDWVGGIGTSTIRSQPTTKKCKSTQTETEDCAQNDR